MECLATPREGLGPCVRVGGLWGSSCAYFAAALADRLQSGLLVIASSVEATDEFTSDFHLFSDIRPMLFPAWDTLPDEGDLVNHEVFGERLGVLRELLFERDSSARRCEVVIASIQSLLQPVVSPDALLKSSLEFKVGAELRPEELAGLLVDEGFERGEVASLPGEFAMRGGILDVFPYGTLRPLRIEFFDDRVESVREFDPGTQRLA